MHVYIYISCPVYAHTVRTGGVCSPGDCMETPDALGQNIESNIALRISFEI